MEFSEMRLFKCCWSFLNARLLYEVRFMQMLSLKLKVDAPNWWKFFKRGTLEISKSGNFSPPENSSDESFSRQVNLELVTFL